MDSLARFLFFKLIFSSRAGSLVRRISWLSIFGISVSVTAFLVVISVMNGMNAGIRDRIMSLEPHLVLTVKSSVNPTLLESQPVYKRLKENEQWKISVFENQDVILRTLDGQFRGAQARGLTQESFKSFISELHRLEESKNVHRPLEVLAWDSADIPEANEAVIGIDLAKMLNVYEGDFISVIPPESLILPMGETPKVERIKIRRIISTSLADIDSQILFYLKGKSLTLFSDSASRQHGYEVWLPEGSAAPGVKKDLEKFQEVEIQTWQERNSSLFFALKLEKTMIGLILTLAGLVASFSILTVMSLLISQKRRDLAILKTLGMSNKRIMGTMTEVGLILGGSGSFLGLLFGLGISYWLQFNPITGVLPDVYYDPQIPAKVDLLIVTGVVFFCFFVSFIGAWIPSRSLLKLEPAKALRHQTEI